LAGGPFFVELVKKAHFAAKKTQTQSPSFGAQNKCGLAKRRQTSGLPGRAGSCPLISSVFPVPYLAYSLV
jgi:hypothetical protein